jgi:site-specific DNA-methyltransferase (adenine-specific)
MLELNKIYNMDCLEGMKQFPDKYFELAIVDPPYGISITDSGRLGKYNVNDNRWDDNIPTDDYFNELFRISENQIIWGGNYFPLPPTRGFIIWDKKQPEGVSFASCEFAWSSFDRSAKTFYFSPMQDKYRFHPTQKPVALYKWLLKNYAKPGDKILDTHVGSASSLIACYDMGFDYIGFEIDKDYYEAAQERMRIHMQQQTIFELLKGGKP